MQGIVRRAPAGAVGYLLGMADANGRALTASQKFEQESWHWEESGEVGWSGLNEYGYTKLRFWLGSEGAAADHVSARLWKYSAAVEARFAHRRPEWFDQFMRTRDFCSVCGESFRLGNLSFCTHCDALLGYCHQFSGGKVANGNAKCPRCKTGEIVWGVFGPAGIGVKLTIKPWG